MKKILGYAAIAGVVCLQACEEKGVQIDFGSKGEVKDTSYMATAEAPQARVVLVEEFTGASCTNCPAGHVVVSNILANNPKRVVAVAYHTFIPGTIFQPVKEGGHESKYDFRTNEGTDIGVNIFSVTGIPTAGVDRVKTGGTRLVDRPEWVNQVNQRLAVPAPVNIHLSSVYNASNNEATVTIKVAYTAAVSKKNTLTFGVIESKIIDAQLFFSGAQMDYEHNHVLRKLLTPLYYGVGIKDDITSKQPGFVYEYTYTFEPDAAWKLENCQIIAYVANNEADDKEVLQAAEVHLK